jgi:hypothetical protein
MKHSADCIYRPNQEAPAPKPGAKVACCSAAQRYMNNRKWRRERDQARRDLGLKRNKDGSWE